MDWKKFTLANKNSFEDFFVKLIIVLISRYLLIFSASSISGNFLYFVSLPLIRNKLKIQNTLPPSKTKCPKETMTNDILGCTANCCPMGSCSYHWIRWNAVVYLSILIFSRALACPVGWRRIILYRVDLLQVPLIMLKIVEKCPNYGNSIYEQAKLARRLITSEARNEPACGTCSLRGTQNN